MFRAINVLSYIRRTPSQASTRMMLFVGKFLSASTLISLVFSDRASIHASSNLLSCQQFSIVELSGVTKHYKLLFSWQFQDAFPSIIHAIQFEVPCRISSNSYSTTRHDTRPLHYPGIHADDAVCLQSLPTSYHLPFHPFLLSQ